VSKEAWRAQRLARRRVNETVRPRVENLSGLLSSRIVEKPPETSFFLPVGSVGEARTGPLVAGSVVAHLCISVFVFFYTGHTRWQVVWLSIFESRSRLYWQRVWRDCAVPGKLFSQRLRPPPDISSYLSPAVVISLNLPIESSVFVVQPSFKTNSNLGWLISS